MGLRENLPGYEVRFEGGMVVGSKLPIIEYRTHSLPSGSPERPIQDLTVDWNGFPVRILNLQMNAFKGDQMLLGDWDKLREHLRDVSQAQSKQTEEVLRLMFGDNPPLICGDFNQPPRGTNYRKLRKSMNEAFDQAGEGFALTVPASFPVERTDFIFLAYGWKTERAWIPNTTGSDHRPLVAEFTPMATQPGN